MKTTKESGGEGVQMGVKKKRKSFPPLHPTPPPPPSPSLLLNDSHLLERNRMSRHYAYENARWFMHARHADSITGHQAWVRFFFFHFLLRPWCSRIVTLRLAEAEQRNICTVESDTYNRLHPSGWCGCFWRWSSRWYLSLRIALETNADVVQAVPKDTGQCRIVASREGINYSSKLYTLFHKYVICISPYRWSVGGNRSILSKLTPERKSALFYLVIVFDYINHT